MGGWRPSQGREINAPVTSPQKSLHLPARSQSPYRVGSGPFGPSSSVFFPSSSAAISSPAAVASPGSTGCLGIFTSHPVSVRLSMSFSERSRWRDRKSGPGVSVASPLVRGRRQRRRHTDARACCTTDIASLSFLFFWSPSSSARRGFLVL